MNNKTNNIHKQNGFTLIEVMLTITIIATISAYAIKTNLIKNHIEKEIQQAEKTIEEIRQIADGASGYIVDQNEWPDFSNLCVNAITTMTMTTPTAYLRYINTQSPYITNYTTSCDINNFNISVQSNIDYAQIIANQLENTTLLSPTSTVTITSIPRPKEQPALQQFLLLDGTRPMSGDLNIGGNTITNTVDVVLTDGRRLSQAFGSSIDMYTIDINATPREFVPKPTCIGTQTATIQLSSNSITATNAKPIHGYLIFVDTANSNNTQWAIGVSVETEDGQVSAGAGTFVVAQTYCQ